MSLKGDFYVEDCQTARDIQLVKGNFYCSFYHLDLNLFKEPETLNYELDIEEQVKKYF